MTDFTRKLIPLLLAIIITAPAFAVTDKEMDEARAIAARLYLRWSNDGSGYLDDVKPTSMAALQSSLKAAEKENIKAFNAVKVPSDYQSWDKAKLVEYWGSTFFKSPGLSEKGKRAKDRVRKQVQKMNVSTPVAPEPAKEEAPKETAPAAENAQAEPAAAPATPAAPTAQQAVEEEEQLLADQNAIAADAEKAPRRSNSSTWIYVAILIVLLAFVAGLMVFAARIMKKAPQGAAGAAEGMSDDQRRKLEKALEGKDDEIKDAVIRMAEAEEKATSLAERNAELEQLTARLRSELEEARNEANELRARLKSASRSETPTSAPAAASSAAPAAPAAKKILNVIYLGRANARGIFVRGDRRPSPGNTVFRLDTRDGLVGTFRIANDPAAIELAFSNPETYLAGGCEGNFEDAATADNIVTESAGTAIFENNCWKVLRKSRIRFE